MSSLLINEPPLQFLPSLARTVGVTEAIILQQLHYWLSKSQHEHEGRPWVYNSIAKWHQQFDWWSESTVKRAFKTLEDAGIILSGQFSENKFDREKWYTIDYDRLDKLIESPPIGSICTDGKGLDDPMINKQETTNSRLPRESTRARQPNIDALILQFPTQSPEWVRERVADAMNHKARLKYTDLTRYCANWIRKEIANGQTPRPGASGNGGTAPRPGGYAPVATAEQHKEWTNWGRTPARTGG